MDVIKNLILPCQCHKLSIKHNHRRVHVIDFLVGETCLFVTMMLLLSIPAFPPLHWSYTGRDRKLQISMKKARILVSLV